ncbi:MAG TPA: exodeoxyribonuclease VII small subunit [Candidatus Omnitrophica bacterium]|nr:exodeoxyribonuclease VII small subunit [Candidatus Omnitrophota bacterium]
MSTHKEKEMDFEGSLKKLEAIVDEMESGSLSLDEAIKKYETGVRLVEFCTKKLQEIKKKVDMLVKSSSGEMVTKPLDTEEAVKEDEPKQRRPKSKGKRSKGEEMLF